MNTGRTEHRGTQHKDPCLCPPSTSDQSLSRRELYHLVEYGWFANFIQKHHYHAMMCCVYSVSCVRLSVTTWTIARQAPLSMGLSRQEYWSGLPFPPPGGLPNPGTEPTSPVAPALQVEFLLAEPLGKPIFQGYCLHIPLGKRSI